MTVTQSEAALPERDCAYRILRYSPNAVRDEWVNIGVLVFDPASGERRLRIIEDPQEFARVRRLHPNADEGVLRLLRDDLESRLSSAGELFRENGNTQGDSRIGWLKLLEKWDATLSLILQLAPQRGTRAGDLDEELERLYADHVGLARPTRVGAPGTRGAIRAYCAQVLKQARLWERLEKGVRAAEFTFPGDPMRIDYGYRRNGTRGFLQALSVSRAPGEAKLLAYTASRIRDRVGSAEFTAVTDVHLAAENARHRFVQETLREAGVESVALDGFAVWTAKIKPLIQ